MEELKGHEEGRGSNCNASITPNEMA